MTSLKRRALTRACVALAFVACVCLLYAHISAPPFSNANPLTAQSLRRGAAASATVVWPQGTVDVNRATAETLCTLNGVGPSLAEAIIAAREAGGAFDFPEDLLAVRGIGEKKLQKFFDQLDFSAQTVEVSR